MVTRFSRDLKVGLDASMLEPARTGVGNYVFNLLRSYREIGGEARLVLFSDRRIGDDAKPLGECIENIGPPIKKGPLWLSIGLKAHLRRHRIDVFWGGNGLVPIFAPGTVKRVVTVHDVAYARAADTLTTVTLWSRRILQPLAIRQADTVICVSHTTAEDVRLLHGRRADAVLKPQIDPRYRPAPEPAIEALRKRYGLPNSFLLSVGTLEPRKNLAALLRAYVRARTSGRPLPTLVLAGKGGWLADDVERLVAQSVEKGLVKFLGYVPLEDMPALYSAADAFIFVPIYEGFGMPAREALQCGTPVIASDIGSLREATNGLAQLVAPDEASLERALVDYATGTRKPPLPKTDGVTSSDRTAEMFAELLERTARKS